MDFLGILLAGAALIVCLAAVMLAIELIRPEDRKLTKNKTLRILMIVFAPVTIILFVPVLLVSRFMPETFGAVLSLLKV